MVVSGQRHALAALYPRGRTPDTHWIGGWVGLKAGLDTEVKEKSFASAEDQTPFVQSVVRSQLITLKLTINKTMRPCFQTLERPCIFTSLQKSKTTEQLKIQIQSSDASWA
jgi:hypothetical protein